MRGETQSFGHPEASYGEPHRLLVQPQVGSSRDIKGLEMGKTDVLMDPVGGWWMSSGWNVRGATVGGEKAMDVLLFFQVFPHSSLWTTPNKDV